MRENEKKKDLQENAGGHQVLSYYAKSLHAGKKRGPTILDKVGSALLRSKKNYHSLSGKLEQEAKQ